MHGIKKVITKNCISKCECKEVKFFNQITIKETISVPEAKPDIEDIVSAIVEPEIVSSRVISTPVGISSEGQQLTGKKISVEIKLKQKILYIANEPSQSVHAVENIGYQSAFVVVPLLIEGSEPEALLNCKYLQPEVIIENVATEIINRRTILKNLALLVQVKLVPTYEICCSEDNNCTNSDLYICFEDGSRKKKLTDFDNYKIKLPQWSPCGQKLAYICYDKCESIICVTDIRSNTTIQLTDPIVFKHITSFCWSKDNNTIYFTSLVKGCREIFCIDINSLKYKQVTYCNCVCENYNPKCSPDGEWIAFIRLVNKCSDIYIMKKNGIGIRRITTCGDIKEYCWGNDSRTIVYTAPNRQELSKTLGAEKNKDTIYITDIKDCIDYELLLPNIGVAIRKIKLSADSRYIAFLGKRCFIEDLYIFDLNEGILHNLTNNESNVHIGDYDWKIDSTKIYFSSDYMGFYNIYCIELCNKSITQITNTTANNIKLCYRPKIK